MDRGRIGRIIAVGGGKGGVGKSLISSNLAVMMAKAGARVVVLDADLGAPNLHTMFGLMRPARTVEDFLSGRTEQLEEVALPTSVPGLRLICGAEGVLGSANPAYEAKQRLLGQLARLDADVLLIDVGAGVDLDTVDFFNAADTRLVVMVPEITSLQNAYAFLKIALFRRLQRAVAGLQASERLTESFGEDTFEIGSTMDRVSTFFSLLQDDVPELVPAFRLLLSEFNARIVGNMLHQRGDLNALYAMQRVIRDRLELPVDVAAGVTHNANVRASVNTGKPFASVAATSDNDARELRTLATSILQQDLSPIRKLRDSFLRAITAQRPSDPYLDLRFDFGLEAIAPTRPSAVAPAAARPAPAPPAPPLPPPTALPDASLATDVRQVQRASERLSVRLAVEVSFDNRWYIGQLVEINEGGARIVGIRAAPSWNRGLLRRAGTDARGMPITFRSAPSSSELVVQFPDASSARELISLVRPVAA